MVRKMRLACERMEPTHLHLQQEGRQQLELELKRETETRLEGSVKQIRPAKFRQTESEESQMLGKVLTREKVAHMMKKIGAWSASNQMKRLWRRKMMPVCLSVEENSVP